MYWRNLMLLALAVVICAWLELPTASGQSATTTVEITYLGNEGVMLTAGDQRVLIDAIHGSFGEYIAPPSDQLSAIEHGKPPYDGRGLVLVTHIHADHFSPQSVGLHLQHNKSAALVSSAQIVDALRKEFAAFRQIQSQIHEMTPAWKQRQAVTVNEVRIELLGMKHGGEEFKSIQNLGYVVELAGKKLPHIGDADTTEENFAHFKLEQEGIDVALLPFWYLLAPEGQALVKAHIKPKHIVAIHIPIASPAELEKARKDITAAFPSATLFVTLMQKAQF